jgi:hypothetical protein
MKQFLVAITACLLLYSCGAGIVNPLQMLPIALVLETRLMTLIGVKGNLKMYKYLPT